MKQSIRTNTAIAKHIRPGNLIVNNVRDIEDDTERRAALVAHIETIEFILGVSLTRRVSKGSFVKQLVARSFYKVTGQPGKYIDFLELLELDIQDTDVTGLGFIKQLSEEDVLRLYRARRSCIGALRYIRGTKER